MKHKLFRLFILLSLLSAVLGPASAFAQGPLPPVPTPRPPAPPEYPQWEPVTGKLVPQRAFTTGASGYENLAVGQPGLSFRYTKMFGKSEVPYLADNAHTNYPWGIGVDGNNIWIGELWGNRALKYTNTGSFQMRIGRAGTPYLDSELCEITDVAVDGGGTIWIADSCQNRVAKFNASGDYLGELGVMWEWGTDNDHFGNPVSIAFDGNGNIYVSDGAPWWWEDQGNQRIQVFDSSGNYLATIGETEVIGVDNNHFHGPRHIAVYGSQLFVADAGNHRVQIFDISDPASPAYLATLGVSGEGGDDNAHFSSPSGVAADADYIYVADSWNNRVQIFDRPTRAYVATTGTGWGAANDQFKNPSDVAVDAGGRLYVADFVNTRVQQFERSGSAWAFVRRYGKTGIPYLTDGAHYNRPSGVAVAGDGSIYLTEDMGHRLVKLSASGALLWSVGKAGVKGDWDYSNKILDNPADVALDSAGRAYVADRWHGRVQIYNSNGAFYKRISNLDCPGGVYVAPNGFLYVANTCDHTVKIYNASLGLVATMGTPGEPGSDNAHFRSPEDVVVDGNGYIYVSDRENQRVQVFNASRAYARTMGVTEECGDDFGHFCGPDGLFVDSANRLYVADGWNNRIQVFAANGAYLTTIGGAWGKQAGRFRYAGGVAVDGKGNVYIADTDNQRIQKYARGVPGWTQTNINGFGDRWNAQVLALAPFNSQLYAGTTNGGGAQLWRSSNGQAWSPVITDGFGDINNFGIDYLIEFNQDLYAGTWNCAGVNCSGGQVWRSPDGTSWGPVVSDGFGDTVNGEVFSFEVFNSQLYASTWSYNQSVHGSEVWRSSTGDSGSWSRVVSNGFGDNGNNIMGFEVFKGYLYAGTMNGNNGSEIWRSASGDAGDWTQVNTDGFGEAENDAIGGLAVFNNYLYASLSHQPGAGAQVWRCQVCDGSDWVKVVDNGFGNAGTRGIGSLEVANGKLYFMVGNYNAGVEVWRTANGTGWEQVGFAGFGDSSNNADSWNNAKTVFNNRLYIGTFNPANGGEIWLRNPEPVTKKFTSVAAQDGWVLESSENSNKGGNINASQATFQLGDDTADRQYRAILSFNTAALPDNAVITKVQLKIKKQGLAGTDPFTILGGLIVDIRMGKFGTSSALQAADFQAAPSKGGVATFDKKPASGWYIADFGSAGWSYINLTGTTQFRLRFTKDDNDDLGADYMNFYSGNAAAASRPQLIITYTVP